MLRDPDIGFRKIVALEEQCYLLAESDDGLLLPRDELIGKTFSEVMPPAVATDCMAAVRSLTREGETKLFHYEVSSEEREQIDECLCTCESRARPGGAADSH